MIHCQAAIASVKAIGERGLRHVPAEQAALERKAQGMRAFHDFPEAGGHWPWQGWGDVCGGGRGPLAVGYHGEGTVWLERVPAGLRGESPRTREMTALSSTAAGCSGRKHTCL